MFKMLSLWMTGGFPDSKGFFNLIMPNKLILHEVGTNQVSIRFSQEKVWITFVDKDNPQEPFVCLDKEDWDAFKNFVDCKFLADINFL